MEESYKTNPAIQNGQVLSWIRPFKIWLQYIQLYGDPVVLDDGMYSFSYNLYSTMAVLKAVLLQNIKFYI